MLLFSKVDKQHLFLFWNGAKTKEEKKEHKDGSAIT